MNATQSLLTKSEAAKILAVTTGQLARMASRGEVPCVKLPNREVRFIERDLWTWVESQRSPTTTTTEAEPQ